MDSDHTFVRTRLTRCVHWAKWDDCAALLPYVKLCVSAARRTNARQRALVPRWNSGVAELNKKTGTAFSLEIS